MSGERTDGSNMEKSCNVRPDRRGGDDLTGESHLLVQSLRCWGG